MRRSKSKYFEWVTLFYSDKIHYDNHETLEEAIRRENHLYEKRRGRPVFQKYWNDKMKVKRRKGRKVLATLFKK
jgi:hypothetical protein